MTPGRWAECQNPAYCEMFHRESFEGKYDHPKYQKAPQGQLLHSTPISLSLAQKARNLAGSTSAIVFGKRTTQEQRSAREAVCNSCEFQDKNSCAVCGCRLSQKRKFDEVLCPVLKWDGDVEKFQCEPNVTSIACGVTTCQRREPTLEKTVESLRMAGFFPQVVEDTNRTGSWNAFRRCLAQIIASAPTATCYAVFQDDVKVSLGAAQYLRDTLWPRNAGVLSMYRCGMFPEVRRGWIEHSGQTYGGLAFLFNPLSARRLIADTTPARMGECVSDLKVGRWCKKSGFDFYMHSPSLVQHTGRTSTVSGLGMAKSRRASEFCDDVAKMQNSS